MALTCDAGPLYAAMDRADTDHAACAQLLPDSSERLLLPAPVVVELEWLASSRLDPAAFFSFLADVEADHLRIVDLARADYARIRELRTRHADLRLGSADAAVVAIVERPSASSRRLTTAASARSVPATQMP